MLKIILQVAFLSIVIKTARSDTNYRLNTTIKPSAYSIGITPYFDTQDKLAFTFDGEVAITFVPESNINTIKLHSEDLIFTADNITLSSGTVNINLHPDNPLEFEEKYTFAHINLENEVRGGNEYVLKIVYRGPIRSDLYGFYRNYYIEKGNKKWLGATQMESTHARKVFPCFDEPELKAIFTLTIDRPEHYKPSLANTKLQTSIPQSNGYIRDIFYPTPKMSTYLVAFLISEFEAGATFENGTKELGIYSRPEAKNQSEFAFDFGLRVVEALGNYFGIDYYSTDSNLKLDHIALPDFRAGAMENWGLVKYREASLLYVPGESNPYYKYGVAQIVAHETTHMWFGNLVTCHWWSNTWLNEGFANYFQDYITAMIEPEVGSQNRLVVVSVYTAYDADDNNETVPITNENVNSPAEISGHFGAITYQKAGSVIRMMHHFIGDDAFKYGLNTYLTTNKFESGYPEKLYTALNIGVTTFDSLSSFPDSDIASVMNSWISQPGHPILNVQVDYENSTVVITQKRFYIDSSHESDEIYEIPVTYTVGSKSNFNDTRPKFVINSKTHTLNLPEINNEYHDWIIFNIQETGLYRVNYDQYSWKIISEVLKGTQREEIHHLNRAKIINDLFAFVFADEVNFDLLKDIFEFHKEETNEAVWYASIRGFNKLRHYYKGTDTLNLLNEFILELMENIINKLGYDVELTDSLAKQWIRMQIIQFSCHLGHDECIHHTLALFNDFKDNGQEIHPSLRPASYCTGLRFGDKDDYEFLWHRMATTNVASEARVISEVLGCTTVAENLKSYLASMLVENSPIRFQDVTVPLTSVLVNYSNVDIVLEVLKENITLWNSVYPSMDKVLATVASALHTEADFTKFEEWLSTCTECSEQAVKSANFALKKAKHASAWAASHEAEILNSLRSAGHPQEYSPLLIILMLICKIFSSL